MSEGHHSALAAPAWQRVQLTRGEVRAIVRALLYLLEAREVEPSEQSFIVATLESLSEFADGRGGAR